MVILYLFLLIWFTLGFFGTLLIKKEESLGLVLITIYIIGIILGLLTFLAMLIDINNRDTSSLDDKKVILEKFNIENFNTWFKNDYSGYDGHRGAPGIFLRTDKLSPHMIKDYFIYLGYSKNESERMSYDYWDIVRKDWVSKLK